MLNIKDKRITILGAQRSGIATAKLVKEKGGIPRISDISDEFSISDETINKIKDVASEYEIGGHTEDFLKASDLIVLSPGVSVYSKEVAFAREQNIPVLGEIEFAYQFCQLPVIAVTGSNGKTTCATLIDLVLKKGGFHPCLCGNIGKPFSGYISRLDEFDYVVLEVSSFQMESILDKEDNREGILEGFKGFQPKIAALLNINQNHLDRHQDLNEYVLAKKRIFHNQTLEDYAVLNKQLLDLEKIEEGLESKIVYFNEDENDKLSSNPNYLLVMTVAGILGIDRGLCLDVFEEFHGVEHRLEWVRNIKGVDYINDSKATTAESCLWALDHINKPVVMICGGRDKNIDYQVVANKVKEKVKKMIVIGEAKEKISKTFDELISVETADFLESAITKAQDCAEDGDCVLFSPMCASFDMFKDFEERGKKFREIVNDLKE